MFRRILVGFTLLAFVNLLIGCSTVEKVPPQEAQQDAQLITELVLLDGSLVAFGPRGGIFRPTQSVIRGSSAAEKLLLIPLTGLRECRIKPPVSVSAANLGSRGVREAVLASNLLVTFEEPGGRCDTAAGKLAGKTTGGTTVSYPLGLVKSLRTEKPDAITPAELEARQGANVYEVVNLQNIVTTFGSVGGLLDTRPAVFIGADPHGRAVEVPADSVLYANISKPDPVKTIFAAAGVIVGVTLVAFLIALATKQSCPFIYSFDGERFVFDAEPLGGAICEGLARTDLSRLDHMKAVDGEYRLLVRNEVPETQYIDRMKLLVVDHPPDVRVYPDVQGTFYGFTSIQGVSSATDEKGMSLMNFLRASDAVAWQTHLPSASKVPDGPARHELTVTLPKPAGARKAWLITNIGTSSWGSNMIRKTVEYRGSTAGAWLKSITPGSASYVEMYQFLEREEMYHLNTWVREGQSWKKEAVILGQGPLISEDRVYMLDVSGVLGESLVLRFNPPRGFWTFDYIGVSYEEPAVLRATKIDARRAEEEEGKSILGALDSLDHRYFSMPEVGNWGGIGFSVPAWPVGTMRTLYLETSGYYELHLPVGEPDQLARLYDIGMNPGRIVKAAMEEFRIWQSEQQASVGRTHDQ